MRRPGSSSRRISKASESESPESDLAHYPKPINELLYRIVTTETRLLKRIAPPFGVSILAVAQRPAEAGIGDNPANVSIDALIGNAEPPKVLAAQ